MELKTNREGFKKEAKVCRNPNKKQCYRWWATFFWYKLLRFMNKIILDKGNPHSTLAEVQPYSIISHSPCFFPRIIIIIQFEAIMNSFLYAAYPDLFTYPYTLKHVASLFYTPPLILHANEQILPLYLRWSTVILTRMIKYNYDFIKSNS